MDIFYIECSTILYFFVVGGGGTSMSAVAGKMKNLKRKNVSKVEFCIVM